MSRNISGCAVGGAFLHKLRFTKCPSINQYPSPTNLPFLPSDLRMDVAAESLIAWQPHPPSSSALQLTVAQRDHWQNALISAARNTNDYSVSDILSDVQSNCLNRNITFSYLIAWLRFHTFNTVLSVCFFFFFFQLHFLREVNCSCM